MIERSDGISIARSAASTCRSGSREAKRDLRTHGRAVWSRRRDGQPHVASISRDGERRVQAQGRQQSSTDRSGLAWRTPASQSRCTRHRSHRGVGAAQRRTRQRDGDVLSDARLRVDTQKKTLVARERDRPDVQAKREVFAAEQPTLNSAKLVFLDESGLRLGTPPNYGWAPVGEKAIGKATHGAWCTMTMIGAIALDGWRGFVTIDAATDGDVFLAFVQQQLVPNLQPGDVVVMDNLNAHKSPAVVAAIRAAKAEVRFLPPYSPEYNPIEKAWSKLKEIVRRLPTMTRDAFDQAVALAMRCISLGDIRAWTEYAGYSIASN